MENLIKFSNEKSDIRILPASISVNFDRSIESVKLLNYFGKVRECHNKNSKNFYKALSYAGYKIARTNLQQFYEIFTLIDNEDEKKALLEGLHAAEKEYSFLMMGVLNVEGDFECLPGINPFYPFSKEISSLNNEFLHIDNKIYLSNSGSLEKIEHSKSFGFQSSYERDLDKPLITNSNYHSPLNEQIVDTSFRWLCQCNLDESKMLLNNMNMNDLYYDIMVASGSKLAEDILKLERKCSR